MGLSCRCCKKRGGCSCKACPTIPSETLELYKDYKEFDEDGNPYDDREDLAGHPNNPVPFGPLYGPEPPYPVDFEVQHTCGYSQPETTSDLEEGVDGCDKPPEPFDPCPSNPVPPPAAALILP